MTRQQQASRREFLKSGILLGTLGPLATHVHAGSAGSKLRTAHVGVGGMGGADLQSIATHPAVEVAALCDVDTARLNGALARHPHARPFRDYREMLGQFSDQIDAVVVSTPDHTHAPAAMTALHLGKPVYCQKPLAHEVFEARQLRLVADRRGLVSQMGIQVHSSAVYRRAVAMIREGVIGKVREVHAWSNKNWGFDGRELPTGSPVPETLAWDLWLGTAEERPFIPTVYHPGQWRKMIDFGTGTLGDMGVHIFDTPYAALELTAPRWVKTSCRAPTGIGHPERNRVEYEFPGTAHTSEVLRWTWYDGDFAPPSDLQLPADAEIPGQGALFVGEEGLLLLPHVAEARLYPEAKFANYRRPDVENGNHYHEWVDACLGKGTTSASFHYSGQLTEALLLGVVANRFPDQQLVWDADRMHVTNLAAANELLRRTYRKGFEVASLASG